MRLKGFTPGITADELSALRSCFIKSISGPVLSSLMDKLLDEKVLTDAEMDAADVIQNRSDRARFVIDTVRKKGEAASSQMIEFLCELDPFLCEYLGLVTISNTLQRQGIKSRSARRVPLLKPVHVQARLKFAREHMDDTAEDWENIYPVTKQSKSNRIALMINNIKFHNDSSDRHGAEKDDRVMFNLLQSLGYQVVRYNNLTGKIDDALTQFLQHKKLTQTDSVFVTIMSHGDMGIISGTDSKAFKTEEIFQHLNAKNCPALVNKPKIIIIQACRGDQLFIFHKSVFLVSAERGSVDLPLQQPVHTDNIRALSENFTRAVRVHIEKDFICFHSSTPHTVSYRSTSDGSFFIQTLADVFNKWSHEYDIEELFRKHFESSSSDYLQMPTKERNTLTKRFYLFPGQFTFYL
uniref:Uncharacterized protein n=1 Tax=Maylandia zebra TaxID=106582 RepID=A0A3P9CZU3_9CICH